LNNGEGPGNTGTFLASPPSRGSEQEEAVPDSFTRSQFSPDTSKLQDPPPPPQNSPTASPAAPTSGALAPAIPPDPAALFGAIGCSYPR